MSNLPLKDGLAEFCKKFYVLCLDFDIYPFVKFCGLRITPGLSFFWRPPVVVEQNYPPVHPVMIPGRSLEVYPARVAIFWKNQEFLPPPLSKNMARTLPHNISS